MKSVCLLALISLSGALAGLVDVEDRHVLSDSFISEINSKQSQWRAGRNFHPNTPLSQIRGLLGANKKYAMKDAKKMRIAHPKDAEIPETFDARKTWPSCQVIQRISDQSACGSCWAVSTADAIRDRICIASNASSQPTVSSINIMSCCSRCGNGCNGGYPIEAWYYWTQTGVVTGGAYNSTDGCQNYPFPSCGNGDSQSNRPSCPSKNYQTPACSLSCDSDKFSYKESLTYGSDFYFIDRNEEETQLDIIKNGPLVAEFDVYSDFLNYKSGVYQYTAGRYEGGHAVRVIGWGVENGVKFWLVSNSWNDGWGDQGLFKIIRGQNDCKFETDMSAGIPKL